MTSLRGYLLSCAAALAVAAAGCGGPPEQVGKPPAGPDALHLTISNQASGVDSVAVDVYLDGVHVITGDFPVDTPAPERAFDFQVKTGEHELHIQSSDTGVTLDEQFDVIDETWATLTFTDAALPGTHRKPEQHFDFATTTGGPLFD